MTDCLVCDHPLDPIGHHVCDYRLPPKVVAPFGLPIDRFEPEEVANQLEEAKPHGGYNEPGRGVKNDQGKDRYHFLPFDLMSGENRVWEIGAIKYSPNNWRNGMPMTQPLNAALRHLAAFMMGQDLDPETGESHLDHAHCCLRMVANTQRYHPKLDDRAKWSPPHVPIPT